MLLVITIMVKDEANSIESTLSTFLEANIRHFFVLDTGSTDATVQVTRDFFQRHNLLGHIRQEPFIDFAASRNQTLILAEQYFPNATFFLMPDAEWHLHNSIELMKFCEQEKESNAPLYNIRIKNKSFEFTTARLFRVSHHIRFKGVVHETPELIPSNQVPATVYFEVNATQRGIDKSRRRWQQDLKLLSTFQKENPQDPRTAFYLAQTYECLGELEKAYQHYQYREQLAGWDEENFITVFRLGCLAEKITIQNGSLTWHTAMDYYLKAFSLRPHRIEPLVKLADHYWPNNIQTCYLFIRYAYDIPYPQQDILFLEKEMYDYTRYEIMSRCAWYLGDYALGEQATIKALKVRPNTEHLVKNLCLYVSARNHKPLDPKT